jgi:rhamnose utilization protein RhaD (predicted bifunctional aldolase and dehydrogenase)
VNEDLALRVYTTRLLGGDPRLVLHGGGNTSVKTHVKDQLGDTVEVICIKGSGWDMGAIEPAGLPAVRLAPLRRLRALDKLSDEDMVNFQRVNLLDSSAPNPSVETLLHAFLPHKFIDHTHSTAVLALTDQPDGEGDRARSLGDRVAYVPYTIPGFALAKSVADVFDKNPDVEGLVLLQHGIFTVRETAQEAYERMIEFVTWPKSGSRAASARASSPAASCRESRAHGRDRADPARRRCDSRECDAGTVQARSSISAPRRDPAYVNGANSRAIRSRAS